MAAKVYRLLWAVLIAATEEDKISLPPRNEARSGVVIMALTWAFVVERVTRIELALSALEVGFAGRS